MKKLKELPKFKSEEEEKEFWKNHDSAGYLDWSKADFAIFPNLKSSTKTISIRMPEHLLDSIKVLANKADVPYQSYLKLMLAENVKKKLGI